MIANQIKGKGFGGVLTYLLSKEKAQIIGGNMIGENIKELSTEFKKSRELRPNLKNCVWHASLSLPYDETLSNEKWNKLGNEYATKMGFKNSQFVIVRHYDTKHEHIHIVASRISLDGNVVSDSQDYKRSEKIVRGLEIQYNLTRTASSHEIGTKALTKGELHKALREQTPSTKMQLQLIINEATEDRPNAELFAKRLAKKGVTIIPNQSKTGHISGISFEINGEKMKGSDLGRDYSWKNLTERKLNYGKRYFKNSTSSIYQSNGQDKSRSRDANDSSRVRKGHSRILSGTSKEFDPKNSTNDRQLHKELVHPTRELRLFDDEAHGTNQEGERDICEKLGTRFGVHKHTKKNGGRSGRDLVSKEHVLGNGSDRFLHGLVSLSLPEVHLLSALFEIEESKEKRERKHNRLVIKSKNVDFSLSKSKRRDRDKGLDFDF